MKYLDLETCKYLVSLGCTSESGMWWMEIKGKTDDKTFTNSLELLNRKNVDLDYDTWYRKSYSAFSLEDLLRKDNGKKMVVANVGKFPDELADKFVWIFRNHPDTWPELVCKIIKP